MVLLGVAFSLPLEGALLSFGVTRTPTFYLSVLAFGLAILRLPQILAELRRSPGILLLFIAYAWSFWLYYMSPQTGGSEIQLLVQLFALAAMFIYLAEDRRQREQLIWAYWAGWAILVLWSIVAYQMGDLRLSERGDVIRAVMLAGYSANTHARQIAAGMVVSLVLATGTRNWALRCLLLATLVGSSLALLLAGSRGAIFSLFITLALWVLANVRFSGISMGRVFQFGLFALVLGVGILYILTGTELGASLTRSFGARVDQMLDGNYSGRDVLLEEGLEAASANLIGVGQGNSTAVLAEMTGVAKDPHDYYVRVLIEAGLPGFVLFAIGLFFIVRRGWIWSITAQQGEYFWPLIYFLIAALTGRDFHFKVAWFFLAMNALTPLTEYKRAAPPISPRQIG